MDLDGILILDKPAGITSAGAVARIKKLTGARKVGHAGTLDPMATGVLVCSLNRATRLTRFLMAGRKRYETTLQLGVETDTQDATGAVVARNEPVQVSESGLRAALRAFLGRIHQTPPVFSALKHRGVPLYKLAREGRPVEKSPREVVIEKIEVQRIFLPFVDLDVTCSAGTYIRTLCADIGRQLGCGGHMTALRRTESSGFVLEEALPLDRVEEEARSGELKKRILPMAEALRGMPSRTAGPELVQKMVRGQPVTWEDLPGPEKESFKVLDSAGRLVAVLESGGSERIYTYLGVFAGE